MLAALLDLRHVHERHNGRQSAPGRRQEMVRRFCVPQQERERPGEGPSESYNPSAASFAFNAATDAASHPSGAVVAIHAST